MAISLRTLALLMLAAGASVGVFAGTLIAGREPPARPTLDQRIEQKVKAYHEFYDLDVGATDAIRRELQRSRRALTMLIMELRRQHKEEFTFLVKDAEQRVSKVLKDAGVTPRSGEEGDSTDR